MDMVVDDLGKLLDLLLLTHPLWATLRPALDTLTTYAVDFRYPGDSADKAEAEEAVKLCRSVRDTVRFGFGLPI
ncbi:MAG: HEPN domain-containing protein [Janthinobacterium lividum]